MWMTLLFYGIITAASIALSTLVSVRPLNTFREKAKDRAALSGIFILLTTVLILRVNIGNDYYRYTQIMHELRVDGYVITEPGFNLVCRFLLKTKLWWNAGYFLCFAVFGIITMGFMLKAMYDLSIDFKLTFFMFMALGMYFQTFSIMRYYVALALVMYGIKYLLDKKYVRFILIVLVAASFHKIALVAIPLYFLAIVPWKKWHIGVFMGLGIQFMVFKDFYLKIMLKLYPSYQGATQLLATTSNYANILRCLAVLLLGILYYDGCIKDEPKNRFFFYLNLETVALYVFGYYIPVISRIGYFLNISQLFLVPAIVHAEKDEKKRRILIGLIIIAGIGYYILFQKEMIDTLRIVPYQNWFFDGMREINM